MRAGNSSRSGASSSTARCETGPGLISVSVSLFSLPSGHHPCPPPTSRISHATGCRLPHTLPARQSPDHARAQAEQLAWPRSLGLIKSDAAAERHLRGGYADLASRFYPHATGADLDLGVDLMSWFFLFDDLFDGPRGENPEETERLTDAVAAALDGPLPDSAPLIAHGFADIWRRTCEGMTPAWCAQRPALATTSTDTSTRRRAGSGTRRTTLPRSTSPCGGTPSACSRPWTSPSVRAASRCRIESSTAPCYPRCSLQMMRHPVNFMTSLSAHGDLVQIKIGPTSAYVPTHPDLLRYVLTNDRIFDKGGIFYDRARDIAGNGLVTCPFADHRRQRRLMQSAFTRSQLKRYATAMHAEIEATASRPTASSSSRPRRTCGSWACRTTPPWRSPRWEASLFEEHDFRDIKVSVQHNDPVVMVNAYRLLAEKCDYPLHGQALPSGLGPEFREAVQGGESRSDRLSLCGHQLGDQQEQVTDPVLVPGQADLPAALGDVDDYGASIRRVGAAFDEPVVLEPGDQLSEPGLADLLGPG